ncbi:MAG: type II secretion system protein [Clostridium sp.]|nr:type II secretion system protein [Clostridium sp.]
MLKNKKGITLIALVVTIVVLLILAGVTISLLLDENGIIAKSKDARTETRVSQIEDEVGMWKQHNFINKESNQAQESADTMLESLISRKLLTEDEIDREQELITIKKKDGTIVKEISYGSVTINISKTPAIEKSGAVLLRVDSVEGLATITNEEELNNLVNSLNEEQKKEIIRVAYIQDINLQVPEANCKTFQEALDWAKKLQRLSEATEDAFWTTMLNKGGLDNNLRGALFELCYYNEDTGMMVGCTVTNPVNETSNEYIATENGTYTFKIQDIVTRKTYTKKVAVTNVDTSLPAYNVSSEAGNYGETIISLKGIIDTKTTSFENAYIIFKGEKIDISSIIDIEKKMVDTGEIGSYLYNQGKCSEEDEFLGTTQTIILVKDGKEYTGEAVMKAGRPG